METLVVGLAIEGLHQEVFLSRMSVAAKRHCCQGKPLGQSRSCTFTFKEKVTGW